MSPHTKEPELQGHTHPLPYPPPPPRPPTQAPQGPSGSRLRSGPTVTNHPQSWVPEQALSPHLGASSTQARICLWFCCASQDLGMLASQRLRAPSSLSFPDQPSFLQQGYEGSEPTGVSVCGCPCQSFCRGSISQNFAPPNNPTLGAPYRPVLFHCSSTIPGDPPHSHCDYQGASHTQSWAWSVVGA